jgi:predicted metal-dependent HD superfamily phosphohydrolase
VGNDADLVIGAKNGLAFEDFEAAMRQVLDWHE